MAAWLQLSMGTGVGIMPHCLSPADGGPGTILLAGGAVRCTVHTVTACTGAGRLPGLHSFASRLPTMLEIKRLLPPPLPLPFLTGARTLTLLQPPDVPPASHVTIPDREGGRAGAEEGLPVAQARRTGHLRGQWGDGGSQAAQTAQRWVKEQGPRQWQG